MIRKWWNISFLLKTTLKPIFFGLFVFDRMNYMKALTFVLGLHYLLFTSTKLAKIYSEKAAEISIQFF